MPGTFMGDPRGRKMTRECGVLEQGGTDHPKLLWVREEEERGPALGMTSLCG